MHDRVMIKCGPSVAFHICSAQKTNHDNCAAVIYITLSQRGVQQRTNQHVNMQYG